MTMNIAPYQRNEIYTGECSEMMAVLPDGCIDLTVTSPPYDNLRSYNGFVFDYTAVLSQLYRVTKPGGVVVWVVADGTDKNGSRTMTSFEQALYAKSCGFNLHQRLFYEGGGPPPDPTRYEETIEEMFVFSKGSPKSINLIMDKKNAWSGNNGFGRKTIREADNSLGERKRKPVNEYGKRTSVWRYSSGYGYSSKDSIAHEHPAIFPEALARDHILSWSNPGDLVLDPFMGSGTTAKMAMQNGRDYLGFDISAEYVGLAKKRVSYANPPLLVFG